MPKHLKTSSNFEVRVVLNCVVDDTSGTTQSGIAMQSSTIGSLHPKIGSVRSIPKATGHGTQDTAWQWSARHKGEDAAAAEAARAKERQDAQTQLSKVQRQLLARRG